MYSMFYINFIQNGGAELRSSNAVCRDEGGPPHELNSQLGSGITLLGGEMSTGTSAMRT